MQFNKPLAACNFYLLQRCQIKMSSWNFYESVMLGDVCACVMNDNVYPFSPHGIPNRLFACLVILRSFAAWLPNPQAYLVSVFSPSSRLLPPFIYLFYQLPIIKKRSNLSPYKIVFFTATSFIWVRFRCSWFNLQGWLGVRISMHSSGPPLPPLSLSLSLSYFSPLLSSHSMFCVRFYCCISPLPAIV